MKDIQTILQDQRIAQVLRNITKDNAIQLKLMLNTQYKNNNDIKLV